MVASRRGFVRFLSDFRDAMVPDHEQTREQILSRIGADLAVQSKVDLYPNAQASPVLISCDEPHSGGGVWTSSTYVNPSVPGATVSDCCWRCLVPCSSGGAAAATPTSG